MRKTSSAVALMAVAALAAGAGAVAHNPANRPLQTNEGPPLTYDNRSRGKGRNKHPHSLGGTRAHQRLALKKRNQARHRKACR